MYIGCEALETGWSNRTGIVARVRFVHFSYKQGGVGAFIGEISSNAEIKYLLICEFFLQYEQKFNYPEFVGKILFSIKSFCFHRK